LVACVLAAGKVDNDGSLLVGEAGGHVWIGARSEVFNDAAHNRHHPGWTVPTLNMSRRVNKDDA